MKNTPLARKKAAKQLRAFRADGLKLRVKSRVENCTTYHVCDCCVYCTPRRPR